jgi:ABC-type transport system involved in multi-copper enzyme maturation permease subunit
MLSSVRLVADVTLRAILRDRVLHALLVVALLMFLLVPVFSLFSMRQVQELAITLSLSSLSSILLLFAVLYGASSVWRDIERRYLASLAALPVSRGSYLLGKFAGIALFLCGCTLLLAVVSAVIIIVSAAQYPAEVPVAWPAVFSAILGDGLKYILLAAIALLFSSVSTSFFLPVFGALGIYFAGTASQEVMEFITGEYGRQIAPAAKLAIHGVYWLIPNLAAFDFHVEAIYALPVPATRVALAGAYFVVYTGLVLTLAVWSFSRREIP